MPTIPESELVLDARGAVYHLGLQPEEISDKIILVGDPGRVDQIAGFMEKVDVTRQHREFKTVTGRYNGKPITALSTGIGTDNIDIVLNELDTLVNIDLNTREVKPDLKSLTLVRIGTSGTLQEDIKPGEYIASRFALGFDNVPRYYRISHDEEAIELMQSLHKLRDWPKWLSLPYAISADKELVEELAGDLHQGITLTAIGFYGPQGRALRLPLRTPGLNDILSGFHSGDMRVLNWEMETSALYSLSKALGHSCATICLAIANRKTGEFLSDYKAAMDDLIGQTLDRLTA